MPALEPKLEKLDAVPGFGDAQFERRMRGVCSLDGHGTARADLPADFDIGAFEGHGTAMLRARSCLWAQTVFAEGCRRLE